MMQYPSILLVVMEFFQILLPNRFQVSDDSLFQPVNGQYKSNHTMHRNLRKSPAENFCHLYVLLYLERRTALTVRCAFEFKTGTTTL